MAQEADDESGDDEEEAPSGPKTIKCPYKSKRVLLCGDRDLKTLKRLEHARPIKQGMVDKLIKVLEEGRSFDGVIVLNDRSDDRVKRMEVLDGNHRIEATRQFFEDRPDAKVWLACHVYDHASPEDRLAIILRANEHNKYGIVDVVNENKHTIPMWAMTQRSDFPCQIVMYAAKTKAAIRFTSLTTAYIGRYNIYQSSSGSRETHLEHLRALGEKDYVQMKQFIDDMIPLFGAPTPDNIWLCRQNILGVLMKIYFCNVVRLGRQEVVARLKKKISQNSAVIQAVAASKGAGSAKFLTDTIVSEANKGYNRPESLLVTVEQYNAQLKAPSGA